MTMQWQPIETAPKDGRPALTYADLVLRMKERLKQKPRRYCYRELKNPEKVEVDRRKTFAAPQ